MHIRFAQRFENPVLGHWLLMPAFVWFVGGLFIDGWAHNHGMVDNTFFTPWHAIFYSGYLAVAAVLALSVGAAWLRDAAWQRSLSLPVRVAVVAVPAFGMAGVADLWWHTTYGFEAGIELLVSPPHLALASTMALICLVPARTDDPSRTVWQRIPALVSIVSAWSVATFILQFNHPFGIVWPESAVLGDSGMPVGIAGLVFNAVLTGLVGSTITSRGFGRGALTLALVTNALLIAMMADEYRFAGGMLVLGVFAELIDTRWLRALPAPLRAGWNAAVVAGGMPLAYVAVVAATSALLWPLAVCISVAMVSGFVAYGIRSRATSR
jgi:hypothetical protein